MSKCKNCRNQIIKPVLDLLESIKKIEYFLTKVNHAQSIYDADAIRFWNEGLFGLRYIIGELHPTCTNPESEAKT